MNKYEKIAILYNPLARNGQAFKWTQQVKTLLEQDPNVFLTTHDITKGGNQIALNLSRELSNQNYGLIIAVGGDGTVGQIAGGIMEGAGDTVLGIIPGGTVNNFARALQIPLTIKLAIENIISGIPRAVDIGKINDSYMVSSMTLGVLADIAVDVTTEEKKAYGALAFLKNAFKVLRRNRNYRLIVNDGVGSTFLKTKVLLVSMTSSLGGFEGINPHARVDDGFFHVYSLQDISLWESIRRLPDILSGRFTELPEVNYFKASSLSIESSKRKKQIRTRVDGDPSYKLPVDMKVIHQGLRVIVPSNNAL